MRADSVADSRLELNWLMDWRIRGSVLMEKAIIANDETGEKWWRNEGT